jgi:hypothetical protein
MEKELQEAFEHALLVINEMIDDAARLREKFGDSSKLFADRVDQINAFKNLYRITAAYVNAEQDANEDTEKIIKLQQLNINVLQVVAQKHETGLPWAKMGIVLGDPNHERWEALDKLDNIEHILNNLTATCPICRQRNRV